MAKAITRYLIKNDSTDNDDKITAAHHNAKLAGTIDLVISDNKIPEFVGMKRRSSGPHYPD